MAYMDEALRARLVELAEEIEHSTFRETKWGRRGYAEKDVDDFLDYVVDVLAGLLSMDSAPHVVSVEAEQPVPVAYEEAPLSYPDELSYEEQPAPAQGVPEVETVLVTSTPEAAAAGASGRGGDEPGVGDVPEVTWTPPESPFRAPPEEAVLVSADDGMPAEVEVEVEQEATVAWQPGDPDDTGTVPSPGPDAMPDAGPAPPPVPTAEVHEEALPAEEPLPPATSPQPRPAGKPRTRPGGPQPPPPPWAASTG